jgi:hypothetical protein
MSFFCWGGTGLPVPKTSARGAYRARTKERRQHRLEIKLTATERKTVSSAAKRAGMAPGAYAAQTVLDAAEYRAISLPQMRREMLVALMQAATEVSQIGINLNEAVARLDAIGAPGPDLEPAARYCARVVRLVDEAAELVCRRLQ